MSKKTNNHTNKDNNMNNKSNPVTISKNNVLTNSVDPLMVESGYEPLTTFWQDFSIADAYGTKAVLDTFNRAFAEWKTNYKYLTELVIVLNHKIWFHHKENEELARLYDSLWRIADGYAYSNLKGAELEYFYCVTD